MNKDSKILVLGARGLVGSSICRLLKAEGYRHVLAPMGRSMLDLTDPPAVRYYLANNKPDHVFLAAAQVGGIAANSSRPLDFLLNNLKIATTVLEAVAGETKAKLLFLGSSCIYPKHAEQPIREDALLSGPLEPTNQWYAIAKIAGLKLVQAYRQQRGERFISAMPCNLYGPGDNYNPASSHVVPALLHRFHHVDEGSADPLVVWGRRDTMREFLFVDDLARALLLLMERYDGDEWINIGYGSDLHLGWVAQSVAETVGLDPARIQFDESKPSGTPRKLLDSSKIREMGWQPYVNFREGLTHSYAAYLQTPSSLLP